MLRHWMTYTRPSKPFQNKHKINPFFSPLFWHDTLVFKWWHYHITKNCLALQAWVNSVLFHKLNKLLGIWTQSLGMSAFQIKSKSLWSSPLHAFLHGERANLLRQLEDTSTQWFLVSICFVSRFWDQKSKAMAASFASMAKCGGHTKNITVLGGF